MKRLVTVCCLLALKIQLLAQGFVNLDFAQANLSGYSAGDFVPFATAVPGWTGYLGTNQQTTILYNSFAIGSANLSILGTNFSAASSFVIPGSAYTVMLQAGFPSLSASLAQTALIPVTAKSILFEGSIPYAFGAGWQVSVGGQVIPVYQVSTIGIAFAIYEADVSAFAGQVSELRFTALTGSGPSVNLNLDAISFSSNPVPEPSALALAALGTLLLGYRRRTKST